MIDYKRNINKIDIDQSTETLLSLVWIYRTNPDGFPVSRDEEFIQVIREDLKDYLKKFERLCKNDDNITTYKAVMKSFRLEYFKTNKDEEPKWSLFPPNIRTFSKNIWTVIANDQGARLIFDNFIMTLTRMVEFPYISDAELAELNKDIINKCSINLLDSETCPYSKPLTGDFYKDITINEDSIRNFLAKEKLPDIECSDMISYMEALVEFIDSNEATGNHFVRHIRRVRRDHADKEVIRLEREGLSPDHLMSKHSGSAYNGCATITKVFTKAGLGTISNVMGNYMYPKTTAVQWDEFVKTIPIPVDIDTDYVTGAVGKSDTRGHRLVGQLFTIFQNYLSPLYNSITESQKDCFNVATFDQEERMKGLQRISHDLMGTDFTGYSDYLNRDIYKWMMLRLYKWRPEVVDNVMAMLEFPLKLNGKLYKCPYGTMQGIKLSFPLITDANILMTEIANLIRGTQHTCIVVGDDKLIGSRTEPFSDTDIDIELSVSTYMNCKTNKSKTESWKRTKTVSFCKLTYGLDNYPISGLSGNSSLKEKIFLNDIASVVKHLDKSKFLQYYDDNYGNSNILVTDLINNLLKANNKSLKEGYNRFKPKEVDRSYNDFIEDAKRIPWSWGGLGVLQFCDHKYYLKVIAKSLLTLEYNADKFCTNLIYFIQAFDLGDHPFTPILLEQKGSKFTINELMEKLYKMSNKVSVDMEELRELKEQVNLKLEYELKTTEGKGNVSTKNRQLPISSSDRLLFGFYEEDVTKNIFNCNTLERSFLTCGNIKGRTRLYMTKLVRYKTLHNKFGKNITKYPGFGGKYYIGYKIKLKANGSIEDAIIRINVKDQQYKGESNLHNASSVTFDDPEEKEFIELSRFMLQKSQSIYKYREELLEIINETRDSMIRKEKHKLLKELISEELGDTLTDLFK